jgi:MFS family permease
MNRDLSSPSAVEAPTKVRYGVLGFVCTLSMITYLDRVCFASAVTSLIEDFKNLHGISLTTADFGLAFTAFAFAYAVFEIPSGWLGDVFGPRGVLIRIVLWWSVFTALTATVGLSFGNWVIGLTALSVIRFLFGIGEAGAYPNITRALHNWFPFSERGLAQGTVWMAGRLMGGLTPLVWLLLVEQLDLSWRGAFWLFGALGVTWCVAFGLWFRNRPEQVPAVNEAELQLIHAGRSDTKSAHADVPWLKLVTNTNLWAICLMYFCASYAWYFNITYLPKFLKDHYDIADNDVIGALYKGGPLWMGAAACIVGGVLTDRLIRQTGNRKWGRRLFGVVGQSLCALCFLGCLFVPKGGGNVVPFFLAISLAAFFNDLTMGAAWSVCQDIGRRYAAIVAGCMNTVGNLGGAVAGTLTALYLKYSLEGHAAGLGIPVERLSDAERIAGELPGYNLGFLTFAAASLVAVILWLRIDATRPVSPDA